MARIKRYDLYEGDGEVIGEEEAWGRHSALPGKTPLGRDEDLRAKDEASRQAEQRYRYFARNREEDDGLGAPGTLFDDFDRFDDPDLWEDRSSRRAQIYDRADGLRCDLAVPGNLSVPADPHYDDPLLCRRHRRCDELPDGKR